MKTGDEIVIIKSDQLLEMKLAPLAGLRAKISKPLLENRTPGAIVRLADNKEYMGLKMWFIPLSAILTKQQAEKFKKEQLINGIML